MYSLWNVPLNVRDDTVHRRRAHLQENESSFACGERVCAADNIYYLVKSLITVRSKYAFMSVLITGKKAIFTQRLSIVPNIAPWNIYL